MYTAGARGERISKSDKLAVGLRRKKCVVRVGLADTTTTNKQRKKKLTAPGIPRRSPIQVLTRPDVGWFPRSDEIGRVPRGMAVSEGKSSW